MALSRFGEGSRTNQRDHKPDRSDLDLLAICQLIALRPTGKKARFIASKFSTSILPANYANERG